MAYNVGYSLGQLLATALGTIGLPLLALWFVRSVYLGFRQHQTSRIVLGIIAILVCGFFWLAWQAGHAA